LHGFAGGAFVRDVRGHRRTPTTAEFQRLQGSGGIQVEQAEPAPLLPVGPCDLPDPDLNRRR
jgi:hypothetical protein